MNIALFGSGLPGVIYTLLAIALLFSGGFWLSTLLLPGKTLAEVCIGAPVLGLMVWVLGLTNLNYIGVPDGLGTPLLGTLLVCASLLTARRARGRFAAAGQSEFAWLSLSIAFAAPLLFLLPYLVTGTYNAFNDEIYYVSVADFVRDHSYFASTAATPRYPWLAQMHLAQIVWGRMGAQHLLAALSALTGTDGERVFLPVSAGGVFAACCGFWILVRAFTRSALASLAGVILYAGNVTFVHYAAGLNYASQTLALGGMYALIALFTDGLADLKARIMAAVILAGLVSIYPEIFPAAAVPIAIGAMLWVARPVLGRDAREARRRILDTGARWGQVLAGALLLNPYTWAHFLPIVVKQYNSTQLGISFLPLFRPLLGMCLGLSGPEPVSWLALLRPTCALLLAVAVFGIIRMAPKTRWLVILSGTAYAALALMQFFVRHFPYAGMKILVYSFYLVPVVMGYGFAVLLRYPSRRLRWSASFLCLVWLGWSGWAFTRFAITCYFSSPHPGTFFAPHPDMPARAQWRSLAEIKNLEYIPRSGETTLLACHPDSLSRWVPYFYRKPVGDLFPSVYYYYFAPAVKDPGRFDWYLFYRPDTQWRDEDSVLFDNGLFTFSRAQTALMMTADGWYGAEAFHEKYAHWLKQRGRVLLIAPHQDVVTLQSSVRLAPGKQPKHLRYILDGMPAGGVFLERDGDLETPRFNLSPGFHQLIFETDEKPCPPRGDSRSLNLWFGDLRLTQPARRFLDTHRASDTASIVGLTSDRWVTKDGVRVVLRNSRTPEVHLEIKGHALASSIPGAITVRSGDGTSATVAVPPDVVFDIQVKLRVKPAAEDLHLTLIPGKTASPASLGINKSDPRALGFLLNSIGIAE